MASSTILVVEDDDAIRRMVSASLKHFPAYGIIYDIFFEVMLDNTDLLKYIKKYQ